jgi:D-sedoheptulose 7-phosphate isomerase
MNHRIDEAEALQQYGAAIEVALLESRDVISALAGDRGLVHALACAAAVCIDALRAGRKILFAGNGGSAADAQHLAGELVSRFNYDRPALAAVALNTDTAILTAIGNDYGFEQLFARQLQAIGGAGDVLVAISTSGRSPNVVKAVEVARGMGITTIALCGQAGTLADGCDIALRMPSTCTPHIQEGHIIVGHTLCALIERAMFPKG